MKTGTNRAKGLSRCVIKPSVHSSELPCLDLAQTIPQTGRI